ncbi:MAG: SH3 domain-containing protein [Acutalibacteraceae bacterium]|jgi:uncharacterized protein YgiM (DUF1202 family)
MKPRVLLIASAAALIAGLSACAPAAAPAEPSAQTTTSAVPTVSTTALPSVGYIHGHAASVRSGAGLAYKAIGGVQLGEEIVITGKQGDWYAIQFDGQTGYVSGQFVRFTPWDPDATATAQSVPSTTAATQEPTQTGSNGEA